MKCFLGMGPGGMVGERFYFVVVDGTDEDETEDRCGAEGEYCAGKGA
jgi:hypothetical protein